MNEKLPKIHEENFRAEALQDENGIYTFYLASHKSGPIVSSSDQDESEKKWWEALSLIISIEDLIIFGEKNSQEK